LTERLDRHGTGAYRRGWTGSTGLSLLECDHELWLTHRRSRPRRPGASRR